MDDAELGTAETRPRFFATQAEFFDWLEDNHADLPEAFVGFYKKGSGLPSITWPEAVDVALCYGWIDGKGKSIDATSHMVRFTPRRKGSIWSAVNVGRVQALTEQGLMRPEGLAAFALRKEAKTAIYSHEQNGTVELDEACAAQFKANPAAWEYFQACPPSYRKAATWWVISAKREETRNRRLQSLIEESAAGRTVAFLTRGRKT